MLRVSRGFSALRALALVVRFGSSYRPVCSWVLVDAKIPGAEPAGAAVNSGGWFEWNAPMLAGEARWAIEGNSVRDGHFCAAQ